MTNVEIRCPKCNEVRMRMSGTNARFTAGRGTTMKCGKCGEDLAMGAVDSAIPSHEIRVTHVKSGSRRYVEATHIPTGATAREDASDKPLHEARDKALREMERIVMRDYW